MLARQVEQIHKALDERISQISQQLGNGNAADFSAYQRDVGRIRGLKEAQGILAEGFKAIEKNDD